MIIHISAAVLNRIPYSFLFYIVVDFSAKNNKENMHVIDINKLKGSDCDDI